MTAPGRSSVSPASLDLHLAEHLGDDDLDVLVVDLHALACGRRSAPRGPGTAARASSPRDAEDVVRHQRAVDQRVAGLDVVAGVDAEVLAVRDVVLASPMPALVAGR